jgi:hypothetical protein
MNRIAIVLGVGLCLAAAACGETQRRSDQELIAYGGPAARQLPPSADPKPSGQRLPDEVLRDPQERMTAILQLRRQIVYKTRGIPEGTYQRAVRPGLARQLTAIGFRATDVQSILDDVDYSRRQRGE